MRIKSLAAVFLSAAVIGACLASPFFVPKLLDSGIDRSVQTIRRETEENEGTDLLKKLEIYLYHDRLTVNENEYGDVTAEEFQKEYEAVAGLLAQELSYLQELGLAPEEIDMGDYENVNVLNLAYTKDNGDYARMYKAQFYSGEKYNQLELVAEETSGKIVSIQYFGEIGDGFQRNEEVEYEGAQRRIPEEYLERWGEYLGIPFAGAYGEYELEEYESFFRYSGSERSVLFQMYLILESAPYGYGEFAVTPSDILSR